MQTQRKKPSYLEKGAYLHDTLSAKKLESGKPVNLIMFDGKDEMLGVDYRTQGQNPFESGRGSVLALEMGVLSPTGEEISANGGTTDIARHKAAEKLINLLTFQIKRGPLYLHKGNMAKVMAQDLPRLYRPSLENSSSPANIVRPFALAQGNRTLESARVGMYPLVFSKPLSYEQQDVAFEMTVTSRNKEYTVDAELADHLVFVRPLFLELPKIST
jgi:hypothetical protein